MNSVTEFLSAFYPDETEPIWFRTFDSKHIPKDLIGFPQNIETSRKQLATDRALQERLREINRTQGIYFVVNAGGKKDADITRINAIYCEIDDRPIIEQHDFFDNQSAWMPSIRIETRKSVHAYWLLSEPVTVAEFENLQHGLIQFHRSDKSIHNPSRVMRVPFFNHVHFENGYQYQKIACHTWRTDLRYTLAELQQGFPYTKPKPQVYDFKPSGRMETLDDVKAELRRRIMETPSWKSHGKWGSANAKCHNGEGDTGIRIDLASGAVTCWSECTLKQILEAYGLELPQSRKWEYQPRRQQTSELYQWYQAQKQHRTTSQI